VGCIRCLVFFIGVSYYLRATPEPMLSSVRRYRNGNGFTVYLMDPAVAFSSYSVLLRDRIILSRIDELLV